MLCYDVYFCARILSICLDSCVNANWYDYENHMAYVVVREFWFSSEQIIHIQTMLELCWHLNEQQHAGFVLHMVPKLVNSRKQRIRVVSKCMLASLRALYFVCRNSTLSVVSYSARPFN